jgi:pimeloyl-ACP methyl ester carboxylesterase
MRSGRRRIRQCYAFHGAEVMGRVLGVRASLSGAALSLLRTLAERGARVGFLHGLRYAVRGPAGAPEILILHGLGDSIAGWARVLGPLSRTHRVHIVDLPGHGLSPSPPDFRLQTLLDPVARYAAGMRAPVLVGHSLGGWLAARLALRPQTAAAGLILVNPAGALLPRDEWTQFRALFDSGDANGYIERAFHRAPLALRLFPAEIARAMASPVTRAFLDAVAPDDFLRDAELASLRMPVRLVWGDCDRLLPAGTLPFFRAHLPSAEIVLLPRAGHLPHLETPAELARGIAVPFSP